MLKGIQDCFRLDKVLYTKHARNEMEGESYEMCDLQEFRHTNEKN